MATTIRQKIVRAFTHQWYVKIYVFLLAIVLWALAVSNQSYETIMDIPLVPVQIKSNKIIVSDIPPTVRVRFTGLGKDLLYMRYMQHGRVELDLHTINYFYDYPLQLNYVITPPGLEVTPQSIIAPDTVYIRLEDLETRRMPVLANVEVEPRSGYTMAAPVSVFPESVTVSGPRTIMRRMQYLMTDSLQFADIRRVTHETIPLQIPDETLTVSPSEVAITIDVDRIAQRELERIPVGAIHIPSGRRVQMEPSRIDVIVTGPAKVLAELSADSIDAFVNLREWTPERREYTPEFRLPQWVELMRSVPERVRVRVEVGNGR